MVGHYLPGYKAGGPIQSVAAIVQRLSREFAFHIVTQDRDLGDDVSYAGIAVSRWNDTGSARVFYSPRAMLGLGLLRQLLAEVDPDLVYLNSLFGFQTRQYALLRAVRLVPYAPVVLAPRGELSPGALALKAGRKRTYVALASALGLHRMVTWHASATEEAEEIAAVFGTRLRINIAPNLSVAGSFAEDTPEPPLKKSGSVRFVYLSRVTRKKNLAQAIQLVGAATGRVELDVYGVVDDEGYWEECRRLIVPTARVVYRGSLPHGDVLQTLARYHFLLLPTLGENFGHAILEALLAGLPVLIGDQTHGATWRRGVRMGSPVENKGIWAETMARCIAMNESESRDWSVAARSLGRTRADDSDAVEKNRVLFREAIQAGRETPRRAASEIREPPG
jgi:glycosyltransferase involved in cell wall biosynthesis